MKAKPLLVPLACLTLLTYSVISPCGGAGIITFDDLSETGTGTVVLNGYQGLTWSNFWAKNAFLHRDAHGLSGYYFGMVSASNVIFNAGDSDPEIGSPGVNFSFLSAYLTGAWNSNLNIQVQGFSGADLLYDTSVVASATSPTSFIFNYLNIDRLRFSSSGGQDAGFPEGAGSLNFVMDNLSIEFVPEPSTVLLAALGALTLCAFLRRNPHHDLG